MVTLVFASKGPEKKRKMEGKRKARGELGDTHDHWQMMVVSII